MKKLQSFFAVLLSFCILFSSLSLSAQTVQYLVPRRPMATEQDKIKDLVKFLNEQALKRRPNMTLDSLLEDSARDFKVNAQHLTAVLNDSQYVQSLSEEDASSLISLIAFADFEDDASAQRMVNVAISKLNVPYNEKDKNYPLHMFYVLALVEMGHHLWMWRQVQEWAFNEVNAMTNHATPDKRVWAAYVLMLLAYQSENEQNIFISEYDDQETVAFKRAVKCNLYVMDDNARWRFEKRIENLINRFNWLQYERTDYYVTGVKNKIPLTNQAALISLFAQASSWFAMKDDDSFLKQMVSTGGLNGLGRAAMTNEENTPGRFMDNMENFYLHHPVPGTDGKGHFTTTANGHRHLSLALLVQALLVSYVTHGTDEGNASAQAFIRNHMRTNPKGEFSSYLFIVLQGMRLCNLLFDSASLYGWEKEMAALQKEMANKLQKGYKWNRICADVQGACEVSTEWIAVGKVLGWMFRGVGKGASAVSKQVVKMLPPKAVFGLAVVQIAAKQGGRTVARWGKQMVHSLLGECGWKAVATGAGGSLLLRSDSRPRKGK